MEYLFVYFQLVRRNKRTPVVLSEGVAMYLQQRDHTQRAQNVSYQRFNQNKAWPTYLMVNYY